MPSIVIISLVLAKTRSMWEIIPHSWRDKQWEHNMELRILVLLSLTFQITLIALGSRRKTIQQFWIRIVIWCAYLSADAAAIYAVGAIRIEPSLKSREGMGSNNAIDPTTELRAFWAPFLLMHLGGPDAITAYALEDNELWLRHFLTLVNQAVATLYILFLSWSGSYISWLNVVIFICALIKYIERVWALRGGSSEKFRESMPEPERLRRIPKMQEEQNLKEAEGHAVVTHEVIEQHQVWDDYFGVDWLAEEKRQLSHGDPYERSQGELLMARSLIDIFQPAFTDQLLSLDDGESGRSTFKDKPYLSVFNVIAIELGFIYDLLFTKAMLFQTPWGVASRVVTLSLTTITFGVFTFTSLYRKKASQYDETDLRITFVLVVAAVFLELYAFLFQHLFSDKVICWLIKHKHSTMLSIVNWLWPLSKQQRWSGKIGQFSLVSYSLKEKHCLCRQEILGIQRYFYFIHQNVENYLKERLYDLIKTMDFPMDLKDLWDLKYRYALPQESLAWLKELEFDMCVLILHVATHICCYSNDDAHKWLTIPDILDLPEPDRPTAENVRISLDLSRYMLHLLVMYPTLLPTGIGRIKFEEMHAMLTTFFEQKRSAGPQSVGNCINANKLSIKDACNLLLHQVKTELNLAVSLGDKSKSVMFYGCQLGSQLMGVPNDHVRFSLLHETWMILLVLAALKSKASFHLQQLRRGGELITHVWLLLVQLGRTDHFQIQRPTEIVEMIIR